MLHFSWLFFLHLHPDTKINIASEEFVITTLILYWPTISKKCVTHVYATISFFFKAKHVAWFGNNILEWISCGIKKILNTSYCRKSLKHGVHLGTDSRLRLVCDVKREHATARLNSRMQKARGWRRYWKREQPVDTHEFMTSSALFLKISKV